MPETLEKIVQSLEELLVFAEEELKAVTSLEDVEAVRITVLGRKGKLAEIMSSLAALDPVERPQVGKLANAAKEKLLAMFEDIVGRYKGLRGDSYCAMFDYTIPPRMPRVGGLHIITQTIQDIVDVFRSMGYVIASGGEVETDYYNFEALNMPEYHPARNMQDTFFVAPSVVLRTHTSPVQIHTMETNTPPLAIIAPGKVYRKDSDTTHTPMFHQVEGFLVNKGVTFAHLRGTLMHFVRQLFGEQVRTRFRPSYFPFTEPSAEVDISCSLCSVNTQSTCRVCGGTGWIEVLGCGMIAPEVFRAVEYDAEVYSGFAFGMGVERIAMLLHQITDLRLLYENDLRFLTQFTRV